MISLESRPIRGDEVLAEQAAGTQVLLNVSGGQYYTLNEIGARTWELCDGTRTVSEIALKICEEYDVSAPLIEADLLDLLADLVNEKLVAEAT